MTSRGEPPLITRMTSRGEHFARKIGLDPGWIHVGLPYPNLYQLYSPRDTFILWTNEVSGDGWLGGELVESGRSREGAEGWRLRQRGDGSGPMGIGWRAGE